MALNVYGPCSHKDSDLGLLRDCELNHQLQLLQIGNPNQYCAYRGGFFPIRSHLIIFYYAVATSLRNAYICLYEGKISFENYFGL